MLISPPQNEDFARTITPKSLASSLRRRKPSQTLQICPDLSRARLVKHWTLGILPSTSGLDDLWFIWYRDLEDR